ncbi:MAG: two pore domain potassium channel family protein [Spirochaetaceae bacterium]|nr:two pore domain potassium channel family protein [Spirochaetaceae bacterium]
MFLLMFFRIYIVILWKIFPMVSFLLSVIIFLGWRMAKLEGWSFSRGQYCAFITATTVGYGVVHPTKPRSRFISILIAFTGLLLAGILVALAYQSLQLAATYSGLLDDVKNYLPELEELLN